MKNSIKKDEIISAIKTVFDPEMPINVYDLGLIYDIAIDKNEVHIIMTLTAPNCPVSEILPQQVLNAAKNVSNVENATIELTFEPPWDFRTLPEDILLELGLL